MESIENVDVKVQSVDNQVILLKSEEGIQSTDVVHTEEMLQSMEAEEVVIPSSGQEEQHPQVVGNLESDLAENELLTNQNHDVIPTSQNDVVQVIMQSDGQMVIPDGQFLQIKSIKGEDNMEYLQVLLI